MSYDTTVHDAIDPPQARVPQRAPSQHRRKPVFTIWRSLAAVSVTVCTMFLVTWVVATLTPGIPEPTNAEQESELLSQEPIVGELND